MAKSPKKRLAPFKPTSRKSQIKFEKRMENNHKILNKLK